MLDQRTQSELNNLVDAASASAERSREADSRTAKYQRIRDSVSLFDGLTTDDVRRIMHRGNIVRVPGHEVIFYRDTPGRDMFVILSGRVGVYGDNERLLAELGVGNLFGEMSLMLGKPRNATVIAHEDTKLFVMRKETFEKLLTKRIAVTILGNLARVLCSRIDAMNQKFTTETG